MPAINQFSCNKCDFRMPGGWGGHFYAENSKGERKYGMHPVEGGVIIEQLGWVRGLIPFFYSKKVGYNSDCVCLECYHKFEADIDDRSEGSWQNYYIGKFGFTPGKDERKCPKCNSKNVKTTMEMVGNKCPKCKTGTFEEHETGLIT